MSTLDKDILATLTDDEREALENGDLTPEELAAMQRIAGEGDGGTADDDDDDDDDADGDGEGSDTDVGAAAPVEGRGAAPAAGDATAAAQAAAAAAAQPVAQPVAQQAADAPAAATAAAAPRYQAALPADYDTKVADLGEREKALKARFRNGELEFDDFELQRDELLREREALTVARTKAEISQEMTAQTAEQQWRSTVDAFIAATAKTGSIDYARDAEKLADLDAFVKMLAGKDENAQRPMDWFLAEAHRRVQALHGAPSTAAAPAAAPAPAPAPAAPRTVDQARAARKPAADAIPTTLAQVPGSDGPGDVAGEFADVLALDGMEYEAAIARMTPAQRERFLRA